MSKSVLNKTLLKAAFQLRVFHTHVYAWKSLNQSKFTPVLITSTNTSKICRKVNSNYSILLFVMF